MFDISRCSSNNWKRDENGNRVLIRLYTSQPNPKILCKEFKLGEGRIIITNESVPFLKINIVPEVDFVKQQKTFKTISDTENYIYTEAGTHALLSIPTLGLSEIELSNKMNFYRSLVSSFLGAGILYELVAEWKVTSKGDQFSSNAIRDIEDPPFSGNELTTLTKVVNNIAKTEESKRRRVEASLYWYQLSLNEELSTNRFLYLWIALESLVMLNEQTKIALIGDALGKAYNLDSKEATVNFLVKLIYQLRNEIMHNGGYGQIGLGGDYLNSLYKDLLYLCVRQPNPQYAQAFLNNHLNLKADLEKSIAELRQSTLAKTTQDLQI